MKIKLYRLYPGVEENDLTPIHIEIKGKIGDNVELSYDDEKYMPSGVIVSTNKFYCEKNNTYKGVFKDINFNYKFKFYQSHEDDNGKLAGIEGYAHLNFYKAFKMEWIFRRCWAQQNKNILWILGFVLSIVALLMNYFKT